MPPTPDTTDLVRALRKGDRAALDQLVPRLYDELHLIAHRELARRDGGTVRTTALVHEAYVKLADHAHLDVQSRAHFLAVAATAMRHILVDHARARATRKRGGGLRRVPLEEAISTAGQRLNLLVELDDALARLAAYDERLCRVVECRFFGGLTVAETARALGLAPRTVDRAWKKAKAWLYRELDAA